MTYICNLTSVSNVCEAVPVSLFWELGTLRTQRITGDVSRISFQPDWQIDNHGAYSNPETQLETQPRTQSLAITFEGYLRKRSFVPSIPRFSLVPSSRVFPNPHLALGKPVEEAGWRPRTRILELFRRRTQPRFSFLFGEG